MRPPPDGNRRALAQNLWQHRLLCSSEPRTLQHYWGCDAADLHAPLRHTTARYALYDGPFQVPPRNAAGERAVQREGALWVVLRHVLAFAPDCAAGYYARAARAATARHAARDGGGCADTRKVALKLLKIVIISNLQISETLARASPYLGLYNSYGLSERYFLRVYVSTITWACSYSALSMWALATAHSSDLEYVTLSLTLGVTSHTTTSTHCQWLQRASSY